MKKNKSSVFFSAVVFFIAIVFLAYAGYQIYKMTYNPYETELASEYSVSDSIHVFGLAVRSETLIEDNYSGSVTYIYEDASKVNRNRPIAYSHASEETVNKILRSEELEKEIALLEDSLNGSVSQLYGNSEYINQQIGNNIEQYAEIIASGNLQNFDDAKNAFLLSINKKTALTGNSNRFQEKIDSLTAEYNQLISEIESDESGTIMSPRGGYFISTIDGFENLIDKESVYDKTVAELEDIISTDTVSAEPKIGKIADNYIWYFIFSVDGETAEKFADVKKVSVKFDGLNDDIPFRVEDIRSDATSQNSVVILSCESFAADYSSLRQETADITVHYYDGLKISKDAVRFNDKQQIGVYILEKNSVSFKTIEILYEGPDYFIVEKDKWNQKAIQLYDEVFVSGIDLHEGKVID